VTDDLTQRLRRGTAVRLDSERTATNVASLRHAVATQPGATAAADGMSAGATGAGWRRRVVPLALAATLVTPGLAVAAESSLPGDALHPVKTSLEGLRSLFDPTIVAEHRLDELEALLASDAGDSELAAALAAAEDVVSSLAETDPDRAAPLAARLDTLRAEVTARLTPTEQPPEDGVKPGDADRVPPRTPATSTGDGASGDGPETADDNRADDADDGDDDPAISDDGDDADDGDDGPATSDDGDDADDGDADGAEDGKVEDATDAEDTGAMADEVASADD